MDVSFWEENKCIHKITDIAEKYNVAILTGSIVQWRPFIITKHFYFTFYKQLHISRIAKTC